MFIHASTLGRTICIIGWAERSILRNMDWLRRLGIGYLYDDDHMWHTNKKYKPTAEVADWLCNLQRSCHVQQCLLFINFFPSICLLFTQAEILYYRGLPKGIPDRYRFGSSLCSDIPILCEGIWGTLGIEGSLPLPCPVLLAHGYFTPIWFWIAYCCSSPNGIHVAEYHLHQGVHC